MPARPSRRALRALLLPAALTGCTTLGSIMSPYSERFDCKNKDHGQCIHPDQAYQDAVAGRPSRSDPAVTNDRKILKGDHPARPGRGTSGAPDPYEGYRASVYHELKGLIDAPVTPMLAPARTVRTLILPYADRQRPDRLYMPRYVYSIVDRPAWVVGGALVAAPSQAAQAPVLGQVHDEPLDQPAAPAPGAVEKDK